MGISTKDKRILYLEWFTSIILIILFSLPFWNMATLKNILKIYTSLFKEYPFLIFVLLLVAVGPYLWVKRKSLKKRYSDYKEEQLKSYEKIEPVKEEIETIQIKKPEVKQEIPVVYKKEEIAKPTVPWNIVVPLVIVGIIIMGFLIPKTVSYKTTETYTEQVPYTENVPLTYQVVTNWNWVCTNTTNWLFGNTITTCSGQVVLKNTDTTSGSYSVNFVFTRVDNNQKQTITKSINLMAGETGTVNVASSEINLGYGDYRFTTQTSVLPSQKTVQKTRPETRTREVTKEKQVSLWEYVLHSY